MAKRLYVGNLPYSTNDTELRDLFAPRKVRAVQIITDRNTGRPRGFGFVELENDADIESAVAELNGSLLGGRTIVVSLANDKPSANGTPRGRDRASDPRRGWRRE